MKYVCISFSHWFVRLHASVPCALHWVVSADIWFTQVYTCFTQDYSYKFRTYGPMCCSLCWFFSRFSRSDSSFAYACMYIYIYIMQRFHAWSERDTRICTVYLCIRTGTCVLLSLSIYIYTCVYRKREVCTHIHINACTHEYMYIHICEHMYALSFACTHRCRLQTNFRWIHT